MTIFERLDQIERRIAKLEGKVAPVSKTKRCPLCGKDKPRNRFWKDRSNSDGTATYCQSCTKLLTAAYKVKSLKGNAQTAKEARDERDIRIVQEIRSGATLHEVSLKYGLTAQRVSQIVQHPRSKMHAREYNGI